MPVASNVRAPEGGANIDATRWATEPDTHDGGPSVVEYSGRMLLEAEARSIGAVMGEGSTGEKKRVIKRTNE